MAQLETVIADPNLQPEAVKMILAMQKAAFMRAQDRYTMRPQFPGQDQLAYETWFNRQRPFKGYFDDAMASMPAFKGEGLKPSDAEAELVRRGYHKDESGQWVK